MTALIGRTPEAQVAILNLRRAIVNLENTLLKQPQADIPVDHVCGPGWIARTMYVPKGAIITGAVCSIPQSHIMTKGDITLITEDNAERIVAPFMTVSGPGVKRVGFANEDTVWTTIWITDETDPEKIKALFTTKEHPLELEN